MIGTVIFDMDGVLFDTEQVWNEVRHDFTIAHGGHWTEADQRAVMGANSRQWSTYMHEECGLPLSPEEIYAGVVGELRRRYRHELVIYPGTVEAVTALASEFKLGVASSSPRELVETGLEVAGVDRYFSAVVTSDEVAQGKPEPDVYLAACALLEADPARTVAIEDSINGIRAAAAAGLTVVAIPNKEFPPPPEVVSLAAEVLDSVADLSVELVRSLAGEAEDGG